jgi:hypothetical protein
LRRTSRRLAVKWPGIEIALSTSGDLAMPSFALTRNGLEWTWNCLKGTHHGNLSAADAARFAESLASRDDRLGSFHWLSVARWDKRHKLHFDVYLRMNRPVWACASACILHVECTVQECARVCTKGITIRDWRSLLGWHMPTYFRGVVKTL